MASFIANCVAGKKKKENPEADYQQYTMSRM